MTYFGLANTLSNIASATIVLANMTVGTQQVPTYFIFVGYVGASGFASTGFTQVAKEFKFLQNNMVLDYAGPIPPP
jgi:hypothetical protein